MNTLTIVLLIIAVIVALPFIAALFIRRDFTIEREIIVNKPTSAVFNYVRFLRNQDNYSKWVRIDPEMKKDFRGTDGTVGFVYGWESENKHAGKGEQEIKGITEGQRVDIEVRFERPFKSVARTPILTMPAGPGQTKVRWGMQGRSNYPLNLMNFLMSGVLGKDLEKSLDDLRLVLESDQERSGSTAHKNLFNLMNRVHSLHKTIKNMTAINPYLNFDGKTEEAFNFYRSVFGGEFTMIQKMKDTPEADKVPAAERDRVMHVALPIGGGNTLMGSDIMPSMGHKLAEGNNVHISITVDSRREADRLYKGLSNGGQATMPMDDTFWGSYFGMLIDKFGIQWMISADEKK